MPEKDSRPELVPDLHQGKYSDGHPLDDVHYLECKIILKPDRFTSRQGFVDFAKLVGRAAEKADVDLSTAHLDGQRPQIKEVVFMDTKDFRLYNNAFILRRRITYADGFAVGDPEIVFKFRHPNMQKAAEMDVRPHIPGVYKIKFKAEALPLKDKMGGMRVLFSHNAEFGLSQIKAVDRASMGTLVHLFPCLAPLKISAADSVELVNQTIVEEVLLELGELAFGKGVIAKCDAALWRARGRSRVAHRRVLVPGQVRQAGRAPPQGAAPRRGFLRLAPEHRARLGFARHDQDRHRLSPQGQPAPGSRMIAPHEDARHEGAC